MKSFNIILAFILVSSILISCSSVQNVSNNNIDMQARPNNIDASIKISIQSEEMNIGGNAILRIAGQDSLFMDIFGPFGIKFGQLYADKDIFYFYNAMEGTVLRGAPTAENIRRATFLNISAIEILNLFKNLPPSDLNRFQRKQDLESGRLFQFENEFLVLNKKGQMVQYQRKNSENELELNIGYDDFQQYDKYEMPSKFNIDAPLTKNKVTVSVKKMSFPGFFPKEFRFSVPKNAKVIEL